MGKFSAYNLSLNSFGAGKHEFNFRLDKRFFVDMESSDIHDADLDAHLTVAFNGQYYDFNFVIKGEVTLVCDRCLDDLHFPIDTTYHVVVKYGERYNDDSDEVLEIPESETSLNVAYMLYDTVELAIPIKHVHPAGKCNRQMSALLRKHRADSSEEDGESDNDEIDNINDAETEARDPRWDALRKLSGDDNINE